MAFSAKHLCFLLFIFLISSTVIQARESKFFSKFNHYQKTDTPNATTTTKENELNQEQTSNGYGLYGHDSNQYPSTTTESSQEYTYPNNRDTTSAEEYTGGSYENEEVNTKGNYGDNNKQYGMTETRFTDNVNVNNNNNNNNNRGYETKQYGTRDASFLGNNNDLYKTQEFEDNGSVNNNNGYETKRYGGRVETGNQFTENGNLNNNNNGYKAKQYGTRFVATDNNNKYYDDESLSKGKPQGLSDTRFVENGKYYYNVNNENSYLNNYHPENRRYDGFNPSQVVTSRNNYNYGNNEKEYEVNNFKGESQYRGEGNQEELSP